MTITQRFSLVALSLLVIAILVPSFASAQRSDLETAVWASVLQDPRAGDVPPDQMQILVDMLVAEAEAQNLSASDISWKPNEAAPVAEAVATSAECGFLCMMNDAFGFQSDDLLIPGLLFASSGLLIVVIRRMLMMHRAGGAAPAVPAAPAARAPNPFDSYL